MGSVWQICSFSCLCQGDPLSSALFIIYFEVLSRLLLTKERDGSLEGIWICQNAPKVNHLLFADDLLLFAKANVREAVNLDRCL